VAYDEDLADRIRELLAEIDGVTEKRMFGGLAFLIGGHMAVTASGKGGIMVRVAPGESDRLIATTAATPMEMRGRELDGWVRVDADHVRIKRQLGPWVRRGSAYAASLPVKKATRKKATKRPSG
jgi:TfoX/Sxy family transcriptional regulator of competence genes